MKLSELICFKDTNFATLLFFLAGGKYDSCTRMMQMNPRHPTIDWRRDEHGTLKHARGSWILCSASHVRSKTMHSLRRAPFDTSQWLIGLPWLNVIDLTWLVLHYVIKVTLHYLMLHRCEIHSAMELSRMALLGCRLVRRQAARWQ